MIPVFVCVPAHSRISGEGGTFPSPVENEYSSSPIGYLRGFETTDICDNKMVEAELRALGLALRYHSQGVKADHGYVGALISFAVEVPTYEEACKLLGFVPFGHWTGAYYVPPTLPSDIGNADWFCMSESIVTVRRVALTDCAGNKELPLYKEDGAFHLSLVPRGQLSSMVFLEEDPEHIYAVLHTVDETEAVTVARKCLDAHQRMK